MLQVYIYGHTLRCISTFPPLSHSSLLTDSLTLSLACRVRQSTWDRLQELLTSQPSLSQRLDQSLERDPVYPILARPHLEAIDRRLDTIDRTIRDCFATHGRNTVLCAKWPPES